MINVEPVSQIPNTIATNGDPGQRRVSDGGRGNNNHGRASHRAPGRDTSKDVYFQAALFGFSIAVGAWKYDATQPPMAVRVIERIRKQARMNLHYLTLSREAALSEALKPRS